MSRFDFEHLPDLSAADSVKWQRYAGQDVLPLWIADMDFPAPPAVLAALQARVAQASFGYAQPTVELVESLQNYLQREYAWTIAPDWLVWLPGLVTGLNLACRMVARVDAAGKNKAVFTATPVYPPFLSAPALSGLALHHQALQRVGSRWQWDFVAVERCLAQHPELGLWLLCHPHNPVGRAWTETELLDIARLAKAHDLIVCSDEIHGGLVLETGQAHRPFATLSADAAERSITLMAPSKTFNLAGLGCALAIIPNPRLRQRFKSLMQGIVPHVNALGLTAARAAYAECADWHRALIQYLRANHDVLQKRVATWPGVRMTPVEASYLAWLDMTDYCVQNGVTNPQRFLAEAGVGLSAGSDFDLPGSAGGINPSQYFVRLNFACPRVLLEQALTRMEQALAGGSK